MTSNRLKRFSRISMTLLCGVILVHVDLRSARAGVETNPAETLHVEMDSLPSFDRLDPATARSIEARALVRNLYGRLLEYDLNGDLVTGIPSTYFWRGRSLVFHFAPHRLGEGPDVTANDAARSLKRLILSSTEAVARHRNLFCPDAPPRTADDFCRGIEVSGASLVLTPAPGVSPMVMAAALARTEFSIVDGFTGPYRPVVTESNHAELVAVRDHHLYDPHMPLVVDITRRGPEATSEVLVSRLMSLAFTPRGIERTTLAERHFVASLIAPLLRSKFGAPGSRPALQFFASLGDGALSDRQVPPAPPTIASPVKSRRRITLSVDPSLFPSLADAFDHDPRVRIVKWTEGAPHQHVDARIVRTEPTSTDLTQLIEYFSHRVIHLPGLDGSAWIEEFARTDDQLIRGERLRRLHLELLDRGILFPIAVAPIFWQHGDRWRMVHAPVVTRTEFWKARRAH